jgi:hypothetical protein
MKGKGLSANMRGPQGGYGVPGGGGKPSSSSPGIGHDDSASAAHKRGGKVAGRKRGGKVMGEKAHHHAGKKARGGALAPEHPLTMGALSKKDYTADQEKPNEQGRKKDSDPDEDDLRGRARGGCTEARMASGGRLSASERRHMPRSEFALPGRGVGPKGAGAGSYPIPNASHARNALARVSQHGSSAEKAEVRRKVHEKFPGIHEG